MTISVTSSYVRAAGNNVTTVFNFPFKITNATDLVVRDILDSTGVATTKTLTTDYTVTISSTGEGGSVTFLAAPASGHTIDLRRTVPLTQGEDIRNQGRFLPEIHEGVFDKLEAQIQDTRRLLALAPRLPDSETTTIDWDTLLDFANRAGKYGFFWNATTGLPELFSSIGATALTSSLIGTTLDSLKRTAAEISAGVTPVNYAYPPDAPYRDARRDGAATGNSAVTNTAKIQTALTALNSSTSGGGGVVFVAKGITFTLTSLTLPARCCLLYYGGDDTSDSDFVGTNEHRWFVANANAAGIVNEQRLEAAFNPGLIVNVRKNLAIHDAWLGPGQSRTDPARATFMLQDEDQGRFSILYQQYGAQSGFSSSSLFGFRCVVTLNGIINTSFSGGAAAVDGNVTGNTSGAIGYVFSTDASKTVVIWISGTFVAGEHVTWNSISSSTTISTAVFSTTSSQPISIGPEGNGWTVGLPTDLTTYPLSVGGPVGISATRNTSNYIPVTYTDTFFEVVDSYENAPPNGFRLYYNTVPAAASRRLTLRKYNSSADIGHIGAVRAYSNFTNSVLVSTSAFNVASIVRNGTGDYTVTFINAFTRADYTVLCSTSKPLEYAALFARTTTTVQIKVYTTGTSTLVDLTGELEWLAVGGDI